MLMELSNSECADHLPPDLVQGIWREADHDESDGIDFEEFARWYSAHGFMEDLLLTRKEREIRNIARKYCVPFPEVERMKSTFDKYDGDGSGVLEYEEFTKCLNKLMKVPTHLEMPASRVKQFWNEVDVDGSGDVDFEEFLRWYVRYFDLEEGNTDSPIEQFYKSVRSLLPDTTRVFRPDRLSV